MREESSEFNDFLREEVNKYKGIYVPVKAGLLQRALVRHVSCKRLHPNPDDEFCFPDIGPNQENIGQYEKKIKQSKIYELSRPFDEPITVQKILPRGYLILNGHHCWAAAIR